MDMCTEAQHPALFKYRLLSVILMIILIGIVIKITNTAWRKHITWTQWGLTLELLMFNTIQKVGWPERHGSFPRASFWNVYVCWVNPRSLNCYVQFRVPYIKKGIEIQEYLKEVNPRAGGWKGCHIACQI